ncbi:MAG: 9-O-acetyl-N-acetylneuraminate esterase, partial [Clostridiales bacterium]|nr:9-O-acetyl-N-acetylneuraminate esterase [Clostridiales bacterium]
MIREILLRGKDAQYSMFNPAIDLAAMYGIIAKKDGKVAISNIIFETILYDLFLSLEETGGKLKRANEDNSLFIKDRRLDMDAVAARFAAFMKSEYRDEDGEFIERHARLLFLSFLMPIINGAGHYAVEPQTRNSRRMDVVVFFGKEKFIVELKIWRGRQYEEDGYAQLAGYLDGQEQKKGWLISFSGNKKTPGESKTFEYDGFEIAETVIAYRERGEGL